MQTGHILTEVNKLVAYAKWSDEQFASLIEDFISHEDPEFSALPGMRDKLNAQNADASTRVDTYLDDYVFFLPDDAEAILVYLAGELPERDMATLKEGDAAYWLDPGDHLGNGWYTITRIHADEEFPICDDTIIVIRNEAGSEAEVPPYELR